MLNKEQISVSLVCANSLVSEGLRRILDEKEFAVGSSFKNSDALLNGDLGLPESPPSEMILIDVSAASKLEEEVSALHQKFPNSRLVLLTDAFEFDRMVEAFKAGADGYILKEIACESLIESLRLVALGEKVLPGELVNHLPNQSIMTAKKNQAESELADLLSEREIETLRCLIMGYPNKVIAYRLDISEATVKVHVKAILRKLMVQNRTQAAIWAVNNGMDANAVCATIVTDPAEKARQVDSIDQDQPIHALA
ncbi:MAG: LuxR C-terminal-related transcriptional regulator [Sphingomonadaceae bacterium]